MQQHPVPQNVTQYQFRLVGDMTLKQFLELAGGMVVAYLFFASNLLFFIKWPLALGSLLLGVGLAFFPIEERPLDIWIINFLKSIYAPTRFVWKKTTRLPALFEFTAHDIVEKKTSTKTVKAPALSPTKTSQSDYSEDETTKIKNLQSLLTQLEPVAKKLSTKSQPVAKSPQKPNISVRKLSASSDIVFQAKSQSKKINLTPTPPPKPTPSNTVIHKNTNIKKDKHAEVAQPAETIYLPASPKKPNIVVGMVVDKDGGLVGGAIVEIITSDHIPARAIRTNSLGQFYISTPLAPGKYIIEIDAKDLTFPNQSLTVEDKLISPIILRAS